MRQGVPPLALCALLNSSVAYAQVPARPVRVVFEAPPDCGSERAFLEALVRRSSRTRIVGPEEQALVVRVGIGVSPQGAAGRVQLTPGAGSGEVVRVVEGESCDEVVSALALITALALDASESPPPAPPPPQPAPAPIPQTPVVREPPQAKPRAREAWRWGGALEAAFFVVSEPLRGGGLFAEKQGSWLPAASVRMSLLASTSGTVLAGSAGARFTRGLARVDGCAFALEPFRSLSLTPCLQIEGGFVLAEGQPSSTLSNVKSETVPWFGVGLAPRLTVSLPPVFVELSVGPLFPLVQRKFVFENPNIPISEVSPVTLVSDLGVGVHFP